MNRQVAGEAVILPAYDELPIIEPLGIRHSWNVYGEDDELGTLNNVDKSLLLASMSAVITGERIGLTLAIDAINPPLYRRQLVKHTLIEDSRNIWDDKLDDFYGQASSQWDGFRHVRCREFGFYGGVIQDPPEMADRLGIHNWAATGIVGRGVLLDVERYLTAGGKEFDPLAEISISADLLNEVAKSQKVEIARGDILCIRFGWINRFFSLSDSERVSYASTPGSPPFAGLDATQSMARQLWNWHVSAVACDNPGAEVSPGNPADGSLHRLLIPGLGMVIGELLDFEILSQRCAHDGRWTFLFVGVPTNIPGGVGSPANAIAIR